MLSHKHLITFLVSGMVLVSAFTSGQALKWEKHSFGPITKGGRGYRDMSASDVYFDHKHTILIGGHYGLNDTFAHAALKPYVESGIYLAKMDTSGALNWIIEGGSDSFLSEINQVQEDTVHHFYYFSGRLYNGHLPGVPDSVLNTGNSTGFIAKADTAGHIKWFRRFFAYTGFNNTSAANYVGEINQFVADTSGNICFAGTLSPYQQISTRAFTFKNDYYTRIFLSKFDSTGQLLWFHPDSIANFINSGVNGGIMPGRNGDYYVLSKYSGNGYIFDTIRKISASGKLIRQAAMTVLFPNYHGCSDFKIDGDDNLYFFITQLSGFSIGKIDSGLNVNWLKNGTGAYNGRLYINSLSKNIFVSAYLYNGTANFGGANVFTKDDAMIFFKMNTEGQPFWMKYFSGDEDYRPPFCNEEGCGDFYLVTQFDYGFVFKNIVTVVYPVKLFNDIISGDDNNILMTSLIIAKIHFPPLSLVSEPKGCNIYHIENTSDSSFTALKWTYHNKLIGTGQTIDYNFPGTGKQVITLLGRSPGGNACMETDTIVVHHFENPDFVIKDTQTCGTITVMLSDSTWQDSFAQSKNRQWTWDYGDGTIDTFNNYQPPVTHKYHKSGNYIIRHGYTNGICSYNVQKNHPVLIIPPPDSGIRADAISGCMPFRVHFFDTLNSLVQKRYYDFGDGTSDTVFSPSHLFSIPGYFWVNRKQVGITGCTVNDFLRIHVKKGLSPGDSVNMYAATFSDNENIAVNWFPIDSGSVYEVQKQTGNSVFLPFRFTTAISFTDSVNDLHNTIRYKIRATDSCGNISQWSRIARPVILSGENHDNAYFLLCWTPYEDWRNGIKKYEIELKQPNGAFMGYDFSKDTFSNQTSFIDSAKKEECYRIKAYELKGNNAVSYSNSICIPYIPAIWIPTAFSPNGDGNNDVFEIKTIGIKNLDLEIYNRWGEHMISIKHDLNEPVPLRWDGKFHGVPVQDGVYIYIITGKAINGDHIYEKGNLTVIR
jgi:gliding motility-associated-like protein